MKKYIIGIDTGGTYTDAVLLDKESGNIIATAKQSTTHHKLAIGTGKALTKLMDQSSISPDQVSTVALSSTLATNSVVENKGARVAIIVIGYVKHFKLPVKAVVFVKGGHTIKGEEEQPLDIEHLVNIITDLKDEVDAFGVCSSMSMANPGHELVAEKAISLIAPKPVFCSHRISQQAGMQERAATAGLHAKLMPIMREFVNGVAEAMAEMNITCPMMIVSGNGIPIDQEYAVTHAGATVASGPACTAHFGAEFSSEDSLIIDIGGTTTDITMLEAGQPVVAEDGCTVGNWKTHVEAVDMLTGGVGGDSHVVIDDTGAIQVGPTRVVPLAKSDDIPPLDKWLGAANEGKCIHLLPGEIVIDKNKNPILNELMIHGALTPAQLKINTGLSGIPLEKSLEDLARKQLLFETGFTPTDALHVLGKLDFGDNKKALEAATILAKITKQSPEEFCRSVLEQTETKIENMIIDYVVQRYWGNNLTSFISSRNEHPVLGVNFSLKIPLIGIGAAAKYLLPKVAEKLGTTIEFPENCEVGNAVGAALICKNNFN